MKLILRTFRAIVFIWTSLFINNFAFAQKAELVIQEGHAGYTFSAGFSPDSRYVATGNPEVSLWEISTGRVIRRFRGHFGYESGVRAIEFSPDSKYIATGGTDYIVRLFELETGREIRTFSGHSGVIWSIKFSSDGKYLVAGSKVWDIQSGQEFQTFVNTQNVYLSPMDNYIVVSDWYNNMIRLYELSTGKQIREFKGVESLNFSRHETYCALVEGRVPGRLERTLKLFEFQTDKMILNFSDIQSSCFSPDEKYIALSIGSNETVILYDLVTKQKFREFPGAEYPLSFSPDSKYILMSRDDDVILGELGTGLEIYISTGDSEYKDPINVAQFSPNSKYLITGSSDRITKLWEVTTGKEICAFGARSGMLNQSAFISFTPDERELAIGIAKTNNVILWDILNGQTIRTFSGYFPVTFSPDGNSIVTTNKYQDSLVTVWNLYNGNKTGIFKNIGINDVKFTPNSRYIFTSSDSRDRYINQWDLASGRAIHSFPGNIDLYSSRESPSFDITPDGKYIITTNAGNTTGQLWEIATGNKIHIFSEFRSPIAFTPNGNYILTNWGNTAKLLDLKTGQEVRAFQGTMYPYCFTPDGKYLITRDEDYNDNIRLWEVATGRELRSFDLISIDFYYPSFSANGNYLIVGGKLFEFDTRRELASLFFLNESNWAVVTPDGLFDSTPGIMQNMYWVVGLEVIEFNQLKERYYEPGLLAKLMGFNDEPLLNVKALSEAKLYPEIELNEPTPDDPELEIHLKNRGGGIGKTIVFINDKEITTDAREANADPNADEMELAVDIGDHPYLIPGKDNIIEVKAFNADGYLASRNVRVIYKAPAKDKVEPPTLWGIVAGVSDYHGKGIDLRFAAKDAVDIAQALNIGAHRLFGAERTYITLLTTEKTEGALYPNKDNLFRSFNDVAGKAKSTDILVVYLAGHGVTYGGQDGDYYYLTAEASSGNLKDEAIRQQRAVSSQELTEQIKKVPALKQVLILDTCHSGRFSEDMTKDRAISSSQIRAYERMKDRTGLHILAGAAADAVAYESSSYGQGILTYSLLLGMRGAALRDDEFIDISRLFQYSADQVPELAKNIGGIQRPIVAVPYGGTSFDIGRLGSEDKPRIPIAEVRPLVLRALFQNDAPPFDDDLNLNKLLNEALRDISARGRSASLVFVDADEFPQAYKLSGRYKIVEGSVTVSVYLLVGKETKGSFQMKGDVGKMGQLVTDILKETERWISK